MVSAKQEGRKQMKIREIREEKRMSRKDLAQKAGIGVHSVERYELGQRSPTVATLEKIAAALGVEARDLV
jgi:transcriptional regulator with XRE-family HTH domain